MQVCWLEGWGVEGIYQKGEEFRPNGGSFDVIKASVPLEDGHYPLFSYPEVAKGGSIVDAVCPPGDPIMRHRILNATIVLLVLVGTSAPKRRYSLLRPGGSGVKHPKENYVTCHSPAREAVRQVTILGFHDHCCPRRLLLGVSQTTFEQTQPSSPYDPVLPSSYHGGGSQSFLALLNHPDCRPRYTQDSDPFMDTAIFNFSFPICVECGERRHDDMWHPSSGPIIAIGGMSSWSHGYTQWSASKVIVAVNATDQISDCPSQFVSLLLADDLDKLTLLQAMPSRRIWPPGQGRGIHSSIVHLDFLDALLANYAHSLVILPGKSGVLRRE
ncbi:hypothetical protein An07g03510 [Aspergillus niger]|uniref:Uncharacterized protein n=2 Tax=Aspergillus niger TaxID=5061 RepID=A2QMW1_ASPNC|nr:hypothetical protein An07g03510 [Aspergillus niger]CAL00285.1 hypothetical protein An07g03510 [Aspergillus niger]